MFSHVTVGTNDLAKAGAFYDAVFEALGMSRGFEGETFISYGERSGGTVLRDVAVQWRTRDCGQRCTCGLQGG